MSSTAVHRPPRPRAWLRLLVLLLALLVPGVHVQAQALPPPTVAAEEHDVHHGTLLRPPARTVHRARAPERAEPVPAPAPARPAAPPYPAAPLPPHAAPLLRTVVLRC